MQNWPLARAHWIIGGQLLKRNRGQVYLLENIDRGEESPWTQVVGEMWTGNDYVMEPAAWVLLAHYSTIYQRPSSLLGLSFIMFIIIIIVIIIFFFFSIFSPPGQTPASLSYLAANYPPWRIYHHIDFSPYQTVSMFSVSPAPATRPFFHRCPH